jgi:internalin A
LNFNQVSDISVLQHLAQLKTLKFYKNQICDISFLKNLTQLYSVDMGYNQITAVESFQNLVELIELDVRGNLIEIFNLNLSALPKLTYLMTHKNPLKNIPETIYGGEYRRECNEAVRDYQHLN